MHLDQVFLELFAVFVEKFQSTLVPNILMFLLDNDFFLQVAVRFVEIELSFAAIFVLWLMHFTNFFHGC